jgi:hypothetical protein
MATLPSFRNSIYRLLKPISLDPKDPKHRPPCIASVHAAKAGFRDSAKTNWPIGLFYLDHLRKHCATARRVISVLGAFSVMIPLPSSASKFFLPRALPNLRTRRGKSRVAIITRS